MIEDYDTPADPREPGVLLVRALDMLQEAEWDASIWTDTKVCPWCCGFREPEPIVHKGKNMKEQGHATTCSWVRLMLDAGREVDPRKPGCVYRVDDPEGTEE